jgi:hypothetical protein
MIVKLTGERLLMGVEKGKERFLSSRNLNLDPHQKSGYKPIKQHIQNDIQGSLAEVAVADYLNIKNFVPSVNSFKKKLSDNTYQKDPDIEPNIEVRSIQQSQSTINKRKSLILRIHEGENIKDFWKRTFILALVHFENLKEQLMKGYINVELSGWLIGEEGMKSQYIFNPNDAKPAYFVPINKIHPIKDLYLL